MLSNRYQITDFDRRYGINASAKYEHLDSVDLCANLSSVTANSNCPLKKELLTCTFILRSKLTCVRSEKEGIQYGRVLNSQFVGGEVSLSWSHKFAQKGTEANGFHRYHL